MAASLEITASEFLQGSRTRNLFLPKPLPKSRSSHLLFGLSQHKRNNLVRICNQGVGRNSSKKIKAVVSVDTQDLGSVDKTETEKVIHLYRTPLIQETTNDELLKSIQTKISNQIVGLKTEQCFNIGVEGSLSSEKLSILKWLLRETYEPDNLGEESHFPKEKKETFSTVVVEVGPRLSFTTAWSANAVSICQACGLSEVTRLERSRRYILFLESGTTLPDSQITEFAAMVHDRMTECIYPKKLVSFKTSLVSEEVYSIPVMEKERKALEEINQQMGLAFDEQDLQYYTKLFKDDIKRDPTNVELFDIAQSNSEHSRHWFFTGKIMVDGQAMDRTLMQIVKNTLKVNPNNSVIGFKDNSSAIKGFSANQLRPTKPGSTSPLNLSTRDLDIPRCGNGCGRAKITRLSAYTIKARVETVMLLKKSYTQKAQQSISVPL